MDFRQMDEIVKQLRCSRCKNYLNCPPVVLLPDGTSACGNCTPPLPPENEDGTVVRQVVLEMALHTLSFPCKYKLEGCLHRTYFGCTQHDEETCYYRPLGCPTENCTWRGPMFEMLKHFAEAHSAMIRRGLDFKLHVKQNSEGIILAEISQVPFLVKYGYTADQAELYFEINTLSLDKVSYKLWMFNDFKGDCAVSVKGDNCLPYTSKPSHGGTLKINEYLPVLENPDCILVSVKTAIEYVNAIVAPAWCENAPLKKRLRVLPPPYYDLKQFLYVRQKY